jgi:transposase-like protein/predicted RNA-binding Zn-ribbon protein involved in translation (DUF1610 family)
MGKVLTIQDFFKRFPNDEACLDHLMKVRFGEDFGCPKCGEIGKFRKLAKHPAYTCNCGHHIHPMEGTIFKDTHTPLTKWFYAMYLFTTTRHGVPAKELQRQLGVSYPTAFRMAHLIRGYMAKIDGDDGLSGEVEIDETFVGGRRTGGGRKRTMANKTVVFGMLQRKGDVMTRIVPDRAQETLEPVIQEHVKAGTWVNTDDHGGYARLKRLGYVHFSVNHSLKEWVVGGTHTNGIEGFWSQIKRSISGTHVHVSRKYLAKYLGEFEFRYNMRKTPWLMFNRLLTAF